MADEKTPVKLHTDFLVATIVALIFLLVWPGPLRHEYRFRPTGVCRVDRLNGNVWILRDGKYRPAADLTDHELSLKEAGRK